MKKFTVTLANDSAIFDTASFDDLSEALEWVRGRGGQYHVGIGHENLVSDTGTDTFHRYDGEEWETITVDELREFL